MTQHKSALVFHIFLVVIYWQVFYTVGLVWKDAPDEVVNVQKGSNVTLRWHYEMEENETFLSSEFLLNNSKSHALGFRYKGESHYNHISQTTKLVISGKNDVYLTLFSAELGSSNSGYCCIVIWDSNSGKMKDGRCATISIYNPPRITSHIPQLYCKQSDQVKLQCNATGYPEPRVRWIHRNTKQIIGNSSVTSLSITGKKTEGRYCCDVRNRFGRETSCTTIKVTEYKPENTTLVHWVSNNTLYIKCNASASPPPNYFLIRINEEQYNSTNVVNTFRNISAKGNNTVSCIPFNKYGVGPMEKMKLPVYDPLKFTSKMSMRYNMTTKTIKITCSATGTPKPNITWTKENTEDVVSTREYYEVPYVKCANKTLTFYCHASNVMGSIRSREIQVQVMTKRNCTSDSNKEIITKEKNLPLIVGILCGILMAICCQTLAVYIFLKKRKGITCQEIITKKKNLLLIVGISCCIVMAICYLTVAVCIFLKKRKGITCQDKTPTDEDPDAAPLDTLVPSAEVLL